jgi:hypothetical protein
LELELGGGFRLKCSFQGNLELELGGGSRLKHNFQENNVGGQKHAKVLQKSSF